MLGGNAVVQVYIAEQASLPGVGAAHGTGVDARKGCAIVSSSARDRQGVFHHPVKQLKNNLRSEGKLFTARKIEDELKNHKKTVSHIINLRNKSVVHNEFLFDRNMVYSQHPIKVGDIHLLIESVCTAIRLATIELGMSETIFDSDRF